MFEKRSLSGKKIVMVIAHEKFRDEELLHTRDILTKAGAKVKVASTAVTPASGMLGNKVRPDILIGRIDVSDLDALIYVGGQGAERLFNNPNAISKAKQAAQEGKLLCAICIAPAILANAGLLKGKKATIWHGSKYVSLLKSKGANYTAESVTRDGNIITANGPESAKKFGRAVVQALSQ